MTSLSDILYKVNLRAVTGSTAVEIADVVTDSRKVTPGACFIALKGTVVDGHNHIPAAVNAGAIAVICEVMPAETKDNVTYVQVADSAEAAGYVAHQFMGEPSHKMQVVGVTGTNGKTTVSTLLYQLFSGLGYLCGLVSTVKYMIGEKEYPSTHTTPDAVSLNKLLHEMWKQGC